MIGTFWNICRSCPSAPVDKLSSEYRSTYRWHEYSVPKTEVVRRPPDVCYSGHAQEPALPRRKKHPDLAYKSHEFLSSSGSEALLGSSYLHDRARSEERWASSRGGKNSRRSKSEGPHSGKSSYRLATSKPINIPTRSSTFVTNSNSCLREEQVEVAIASAHPFNSSQQGLARASEFSGRSRRDDGIEINTKQPVSNQRIDDKIPSHNSPGKTSSAMNGVKHADPGNSLETVPVHRKTADLKSKSDLEAYRTDAENNNTENVASKHHDDTDGEFKSEYKKNFQPFNRYDYDEQKGVFEKKQAPLTAYGISAETDPKSMSSWYREVILLRQKANQYRHRGWGTELIPEHMAQLYNDQMLVWEQVSRRSTLSALSLATTVSSRSQSPSKEGKENRKGSPMKSLGRARSAKASTQVTATHQGKADRKKSSTGDRKPQVDNSPKKGNNQVKKLEVKRTSPSRTSREPGVGASPTVPRGLSQSTEKHKRRPRPTSLIATVPSGSKSARSKAKDKNGGDIVCDFPSLGHEQIVKSPPEPTRVKSPEQIVIRSPEPVNWTVPLDTGKTFTVTQNIKEGDLAPRSYSEVRAWTPSNALNPPASVSAPTELRGLTKANLHGEILTK